MERMDWVDIEMGESGYHRAAVVVYNIRPGLTFSLSPFLELSS